MLNILVASDRVAVRVYPSYVVPFFLADTVRFAQQTGQRKKKKKHCGRDGRAELAERAK